MQHAGRKHSKFSASGAERWFNCPGSVALSEGQPDKDSVWAKEGTIAHEVLEQILLRDINLKRMQLPEGHTKEMIAFGNSAADFILNLAVKVKAEVLVEGRVYLDFIHPEMFGTYDGAVLDHFGTLHVFDYKYGAGHSVSPTKNLQMIFYGLGLAYKFHWNFKRVRLWIIQPRIRGYDGPVFWEMSIHELKHYVLVFTEAVDRVLTEPNNYVEGGWCHWCKAKGVCPLKTTKRVDRAINIFSNNPIGGDDNAKEEKGLKSEAQWRKESVKKKSNKKESKEKSQKEIKETPEVCTRCGNGDYYACTCFY